MQSSVCSNRIVSAAENIRMYPMQPVLLQHPNFHRQILNFFNQSLYFLQHFIDLIGGKNNRHICIIHFMIIVH